MGETLHNPHRRQHVQIEMDSRLHGCVLYRNHAHYVYRLGDRNSFILERCWHAYPLAACRVSTRNDVLIPPRCKRTDAGAVSGNNKPQFSYSDELTIYAKVPAVTPPGAYPITITTSESSASLKNQQTSGFTLYAKLLQPLSKAGPSSYPPIPGLALSENVLIPPQSGAAKRMTERMSTLIHGAPTPRIQRLTFNTRPAEGSKSGSMTAALRTTRWRIISKIRSGVTAGLTLHRTSWQRR